jgi:hypothetical protein
VLVACGSRSSEPPAKPARHDAPLQPAAKDAASADVVDAPPVAAATPDAADVRFEQNSGDPASPPRVIKKPTAADQKLLDFARACAQAKRDAGDTNIDVDSAKLQRVDTRASVWFKEKRATPVGDHLLDVNDTTRGCIWIPRE